MVRGWRAWVVRGWKGGRHTSDQDCFCQTCPSSTTHNSQKPHLFIKTNSLILAEYHRLPSNNAVLPPGFMTRKISLKTTCRDRTRRIKICAYRDTSCADNQINLKPICFKLMPSKHSHFDQENDTLLPRRQLRRKSFCNTTRISM